MNNDQIEKVIRLLESDRLFDAQKVIDLEIHRTTTLRGEMNFERLEYDVTKLARRANIRAAIVFAKPNGDGTHRIVATGDRQICEIVVGKLPGAA